VRSLGLVGLALGLAHGAVWVRARTHVGRGAVAGALDAVLIACGLVLLPCLWFPHEPLVTAVAATWAGGVAVTAFLARSAARRDDQTEEHRHITPAEGEESLAEGGLPDE
jgi:hypothetical protein